jgi:signal transduction histidine kinase
MQYPPARCVRLAQTAATLSVLLSEWDAIVKPPSAPSAGARPGVPFNLGRWFAIVGFLSISAVAAVSALLLSHFLTERMLRQEGVLTMEFVQSLIVAETPLADYIAGKETRSEQHLVGALSHVQALPDMLRANIYNRDRILIWSTNGKLVGRQFAVNQELEEALAGKLVVHQDREGPSKEEHVDLSEAGDFFVEIYVPVRGAEKGPVIGVVELYKSPKALAEALRTGRTFTFIGALAAGLFLYLTLFGLARRADSVIRSQQQRLVESEILATVGEMGSAVAHGIRNPLAAIRSSAELALEGSLEMARETARDIIAEADRLEDWVRSLLSYARPLSGSPEPIEVPALVSRAIEHFAREMEKRGIAGRWTLADNLPPAKGDPLLFGQVLHSLLANAVEAVQDNGTIEIAGRALSNQSRIELTIRDSGPGMTEEQIQRLFTPFYTTKPRGMGVGLALAKRIVERFGGRIAIESAPGCGTTVSLLMPVA